MKLIQQIINFDSFSKIMKNYWLNTNKVKKVLRVI